MKMNFMDKNERVLILNLAFNLKVTVHLQII